MKRRRYTVSCKEFQVESSSYLILYKPLCSEILEILGTLNKVGIVWTLGLHKVFKLTL